jgi:hypothetical protein
VNEVIIKNIQELPYNKTNWFGSKVKRIKNQQNSLWLSSQPMMEQIFMQEHTNTMVVYMWHKHITTSQKKESEKHT